MGYFRNGLKVFGDYIVSVFLFSMSIYVFLMLAKDNFTKLVPYYSFVFFLLLCMILYSDMKKLAIKENRPYNEIRPYRLKGFVYGITGASPLLLVFVVSLGVKFDDPVAERLKHVGLNIIYGPIYFMVKLLDETIAGYTVAVILVAVVAGLGYIAGLNDFNLKVFLKLEKPGTVRRPVNSQRPGQRR